MRTFEEFYNEAVKSTVPVEQDNKKIVKTKVVRKPDTDEWVVIGYNASNQRIKDAEYYTNDKKDAHETAKLMEKGLRNKKKNA